MSPTDENKDEFISSLNIVLEAKPKTYIIFKWSHHHEVSGGGTGVFVPTGGSFGKGLHVGDGVSDGGIVTNITDRTITVRFPNGIPEGPIRLPGVDTTVIFERSGSTETDTSDAVSIGIAPWGNSDDDVLTPPGGGKIPEPIPTIDSLHEHYNLRCPGGPGSYIRIRRTVLINPTNTSTCGCAAVYIASLGPNNQPMRGPDGQVINTVLRPGQSAPEFRAEPGAIGVIITCNAACEGCDATFRIENAVS